MQLSQRTYVAHVEHGAAAVARVLAQNDPGRPVAGCPGWSLGDLVAHLGGVHRWARAALATTDPPTEDPAPGAEHLLPWFVEGAAELVAALAAADPDQPCWSFSLEPATTAFWVRRQAHETTLHRWDAQSAVGEPGRLDTDLSADGLDEVARVFLPRQIALGRREPLAGAITLLPTGSERPVQLGVGVSSAQVRGPAELLLLAVWKRLDAAALIDGGALAVTGDGALARSVLSGPLTP